MSREISQSRSSAASKTTNVGLINLGFDWMVVDQDKK